MELYGEMTRDNGAYGFRVKWEVFQLFPFAKPGEGETLASGSAGSYESAGKAMGIAIYRYCRRIDDILFSVHLVGY